MERSQVILISLLTGGLCAGVFTFLLTRSNRGGGGPAVLWLIPAVIGIVVLLLAVNLLRHRQGLYAGNGGGGKAAQAGELGFTYQAKGTAAFRRDFNDLPGIPDSGKARHVMHGQIASREAVVYEHMYMIYNGSSMMPVHHTVCSTAAPNWPRLTVTPRSLISRLALRFGFESGLLLEHGDFNRLFRIKTDHEDFALTLLSPDMQRFLVDKPNVTWAIRPGRLCLVYSGPLRLGRLQASLDRVERFWSLVPEELELYSS